MKPEAEAEARAVLRDAAEYIAEHGHAKGRFGGVNDEPACAIGALVGAAGSRNAARAAMDIVSRSLGATRSYAPAYITAWNDDPATSAEDVILTLKRLGNEGVTHAP